MVAGFGNALYWMGCLIGSGIALYGAAVISIAAFGLDDSLDQIEQMGFAVKVGASALSCWLVARGLRNILVGT